MDSHDEQLQDEEFYSQGVDMIKMAIIGIQQEIAPIKSFLRTRKKEILKEISTVRRGSRTSNFDFTQMFYEYAVKELIKVEKECEQCLVQLNSDLLMASEARMRPSYLLPEDPANVHATCCETFDPYEMRDETSCRCTWENIPGWLLGDTQDIIAKPIEPIGMEFDESDIKFKQDIVYLRTKMFALPKTRVNVFSGNEIISDAIRKGQRVSVRLSLNTMDFIEALQQREHAVPSLIEDDLLKRCSLKFIDGKFTPCDVWRKALDVHGHQYGSKWHLVLAPQIEKIARKRLIPAIRLNSVATFNFISTIDTFTHFTLGRADLVHLLEHKKDAVWLQSWRMQFNMIDGQDAAATVIQALWRGYWLRRQRWLSSRLYVAASLIWYAWLTSKMKMVMHQRYLENMLMCLQTTRELTLKLTNEFYKIIKEPHVVVHLPSHGHPMELRRILDPSMFAILQNTTILRICFARNPNTEVIYILPVKPSEDLLMMYSDFVESISPGDDVARRITFIALSQGDTFKRRPLNVSRILHCSEDTLREIRDKINGKSAYFLPSIIDECDMRNAGTLNVPLLSPDMEQQQRLLNASLMSEIIENFGLQQPPHARNITDYDTLCESLAQLMVLHTEVCMWKMKLNYGIVTKHCGILLINHISVPFMPILRKEREKHGDEWKVNPGLRQEFLEKLRAHLPKIVPSVTQLSNMYNNWGQFYIHILKFGCLLQAIPMEKKSRTVVVGLLIPGKGTRKRPKWLGTADKINLDSSVLTPIYLLPQTSLDVAKIEPTVNKIALGMQDMGYFGYMSIDCYCYVQMPEEKQIVLLLNVFPYYTFSHSYFDWIKFATGGWYSERQGKFISNIKMEKDNGRRKSSPAFSDGTVEWNDTTERYAVAISQVHHTRLAAYRWRNLKNIFKKCGIVYNRKTIQGSSIILHDSEVRTVGVMLAIGPSMPTVLSTVHNNLTKLYDTLTIETKQEMQTNLPDLIDFFLKLSLDYKDLATDICESDFVYKYI